MRDQGNQEMARGLVFAVIVAMLVLCMVAVCRSAEVPFEATCRVTAEAGERGTGCVFEVSDQTVYVLTCAHVVGASRTVRCEFWRAGHQSPPFSGTIYARNTAADAAIVTVARNRFGGVLPEAIPLAERGSLLARGETITSAGCAGGSWATAFQGHVVGYDGGDLVFRPAPANGRSGSAILSADGTRIVGLVRSRALDSSYGRAVSVAALYAAFGQASTQTQYCPPGGQCPRPAPGSQYRGGLEYHGPLGAEFRLGREWSGGQPQTAPMPSPWGVKPQTTPAPQPGGKAVKPQAAPVDLSPLEERLDRQNETMRAGFGRLAGLLEKPAEPEPIAPLPVMPGPAPVLGEEIAKPQAAPVEVVDETARAEVVEAKEEVNRVGRIIESLVGDEALLRQRYEERLETVRTEVGMNASKVETVRVYARDLIGEKLSDGSLGWTAGKIAAGTLGLSGPLGLGLMVAAWLASRRVGKRVRRRLADGTEEIEENP